MKTIKKTKISNTDYRNTKYRILLPDGKFLGAGSDHLPSWFSLQKAYEIVDYTNGERIVEHDGVNILWEVL